MRLVALAAFSLGCASRVSEDEVEGGAGSEAPSSTGGGGSATSSEPPADPGPGGSGNRGSMGDSSSGGPATTGGGDFLNRPDVPPLRSCSVLEQDCPRGEKCSPYAAPGASSWSAARCVPVAPDSAELGESCAVEDSPTSGVDTCELGAMCWDVDPETLQGECLGHCVGPQANPGCENPNTVCVIAGDRFLFLCHPVCDPLAANACSEGQGCYPAGGAFLCYTDLSGDGGGPLDTCDHPQDCAPGMNCVSPDVSSRCSSRTWGCCAPWCDLDAPECPADTVCVTNSGPGEGFRGYENVGICADAGGKAGFG